VDHNEDNNWKTIWTKAVATAYGNGYCFRHKSVEDKMPFDVIADDKLIIVVDDID
jgi:hypothetical protein